MSCNLRGAFIMQIPPTITFRHLGGTDALETDIRKRLDQLERYCPSIMSARVVVEPAERHHRAGNRYHIRIDLTVPGEVIAIAHEASLRSTARALAASRTRKQDEPGLATRRLGVAVREAFEVGRRRLQDYVRRRRRDVKQHAPRSVGRVVRLFPAGAYGFLETDDGHEVYFHRNSVLDDAFASLAIGSRVAFVETRGNKGPQASTVRRVR
jgi:cold shock CspA family protein/ribosome-associated translation inhibitor RaiA